MTCFIDEVVINPPPSGLCHKNPKGPESEESETVDDFCPGRGGKTILPEFCKMHCIKKDERGDDNARVRRMNRTKGIRMNQPPFDGGLVVCVCSFVRRREEGTGGACKMQNPKIPQPGTSSLLDGPTPPRDGDE
jgi:hypothetical protein